MISDRQIAVALRYLHGKDVAPRVAAKGFDHVAREIIRIAREHSVPIQEDADLAQVLVKLDISQLIPPDLYRVVAEILAYVYTLNERAIHD
jgi:flagellar biosynthesis protein